MTRTELQLAPVRPEIASLPSKALFFYAMHRQRRKMLVVMCTVLGLVALWTFLTPRRYTSEMILLVQNVRSAELVTSGQGGNVSEMPDVSEDEVNSEISVLNSDDVANGLVDPNWNPRRADAMTYAQLRTQERAVRLFRSRLDVSPIRDSHAIDVKFTASSPRAAHDTLAQLLQVFLRKQRDLDRLPGASGVFASQANMYEADLQKARTELADYQKHNGFISAQVQEGALQTKLLDAESTQRDTSMQIAELQDRIAADKRQAASTPRRLSTAESLSPATGAIDQLNLLLVNLENNRTALLTKYEPDDRLVQQVDKQIKEAKDGLARASTLAAHEVSTDVNPLYDATEHDLNNSTVALAGLRAKAQSLTQQVSELQSQIGGVESASSQYNTLTERVAELESSYNAFLAKRDAAQVNDLMDEQKWLNIAVVQYPTMSIIPSHPQKIINLLLGLLSAVVLGGCTVFLFETMRQQPGTAEELQDISPYPVLASIPWYAIEGEGSSSRNQRADRDSGLRAQE